MHMTDFYLPVVSIYRWDVSVSYVQNKPSSDFLNDLTLWQNLGDLKKKSKDKKPS